MVLGLRDDHAGALADAVATRVGRRIDTFHAESEGRGRAARAQVEGGDG